jgi:hypothetical protein
VIWWSLETAHNADRPQTALANMAVACCSVFSYSRLSIVMSLTATNMQLHASVFGAKVKSWQKCHIFLPNWGSTLAGIITSRWYFSGHGSHSAHDYYLCNSHFSQCEIKIRNELDGWSVRYRTTLLSGGGTGAPHITYENVENMWSFTSTHVFVSWCLATGTTLHFMPLYCLPNIPDSSKRVLGFHAQTRGWLSWGFYSFPRFLHVTAASFISFINHPFFEYCTGRCGWKTSLNKPGGGQPCRQSPQVASSPWKCGNLSDKRIVKFPLKFSTFFNLTYLFQYLRITQL